MATGFAALGHGEWVDILVDRLRASHPGLRMDATHPFGEARDEAEIFAPVLFADQPYGHDAPGRHRDGGAEKALEHKYALGVVPQRPVPKIRRDRLGLVEPLVKREIVFGDAA